MFEDTLFDLEVRPVYDKKGIGIDPITKGAKIQLEEIPRYKQVINAKTGQTLSVMSKDYEPVSDREILDCLMQVLGPLDTEVVPIKHHITVSQDKVEGRTTFMELELPEYTLMRGTPEEHRMRIIIPNSANGTVQIQLNIMFWRQVCQNGMMGWVDGFAFSTKHRKGALEKLQHSVQGFLRSQQNACVARINQLQNQNGDREKIAAYIQKNPILSGERWAAKLMGDWLVLDTTPNFWFLYNMFTSRITKFYGKSFGPKLAKLAQLNYEVEDVWPTLL